jgi:hypothetical protein
MRNSKSVHWTIHLVAGLATCAALSAQEPTCAETHAMGEMATARSSASLLAWKIKAGNSYRAKIVFASVFFNLHPSDRHAASAVLDLIPKNEEQDFVWYSFDEFLSCETETEKDLNTLAKLQFRLPHALANAVLLIPAKMQIYVSYANRSGGHPTSDYAEQMQRVCRLKPREFFRAVDQLPPEEKQWFLSSNFNPVGCHALHFPEQ